MPGAWGCWFSSGMGWLGRDTSVWQPQGMAAPAGGGGLGRPRARSRRSMAGQMEC